MATIVAVTTIIKDTLAVSHSLVVMLINAIDGTQFKISKQQTHFPFLVKTGLKIQLCYGYPADLVKRS